MTESQDLLFHVGVGGTLALLIIREVLGFLKTKHHNGASGEKPVEYWQAQLRSAAAEGFEPVAARLIDKLEQINGELKGLRQSHHEMRDAMNVFIGKLSGLR